MPDAEDLINAYHTVSRFDDNPKAPNLTELMKVSPLPKTRLRICLNLLERFGLVNQEKGRRYRTIGRELLHSEANRLAARFRERDERGALKQRQMAEFSDSRQCRWVTLLDYFGHEDKPECGHCDRCGGEHFAIPS